MGISQEQYKAMTKRIDSLRQYKKEISNKIEMEAPRKKVGRPNLEQAQLDRYQMAPISFLPIKPLSVNEAWQGKRFKTDEYKEYEQTVFKCLPLLTLPTAPFKIYYEFGFSNKASDIDNPLKPFTDILQKFYDFNDKDIYEVNIKKKIVKKGNEYIKFLIETAK